MTALVEMFRTGGPFLFLNVGTAIFAMSILAERFYVVFFKLAIDDRTFVAELQRRLDAGRVDAARALCDVRPHAPLARVTKAAIGAIGADPADVAEAVDVAMLDVMPTIGSRLDALWAVANVATLVGLIGTIGGLMHTFTHLGLAAAEDRTALLSRGIAEAMNNTAFGLSIAVVCIAGHLVLTQATKKIAARTEHGAAFVEAQLGRLRRRAQRARAVS